MKNNDTKQNYRQLSDELDSVIESLQTDDLAPDEAIKLYEKGLQLIDSLQVNLKGAHNAVKKLNSVHRVEPKD